MRDSILKSQTPVTRDGRCLTGLSLVYFRAVVYNVFIIHNSVLPIPPLPSSPPANPGLVFLVPKVGQEFYLIVKR